MAKSKKTKTIGNDLAALASLSAEGVETAIEQVEIAQEAVPITVQDVLELIVSDGSIGTEEAIAMVSEAEKAAQMEAAWAQHSPPVPAYNPDEIFVIVDGKRYTPDGKEIYFLNRQEIDEAWLQWREAHPRKIFRNKEEIDDCARRCSERKQEAMKSRRDRRIKEALADGQYHNLASLQMMGQSQKKVA